MKFPTDGDRMAVLPRLRLLIAAMLVSPFLLGQATTVCAQTQIAARIAETPESNPLLPALKLGQKALTSLDDVADYEAVFVKKEVVNGKLIEQKMQIRFRERPFSVRLKFIEPNEGREVLYIDGRNGNKMLVQETGLASLVGPVSLDPRGSMAMQYTLHPITQIGVKNMLNRVMDHWLAERSNESVSVKFYPNARIGQTECQVVEATHPTEGPATKPHRVRLYVDKNNGMPIRVQHVTIPSRAGEQESIIADYAYLSMKTNIGLTDKQFAIGQ